MNENETDFRKDTKIIIYAAHWIVPFSNFALVLKWISTNHLQILRDASKNYWMHTKRHSVATQWWIPWKLWEILGEV